MTLIGDTGALIALYDKDDDYHHAVLSIIEKTNTIIIPDVILAEIDYLLCQFFFWFPLASEIKVGWVGTKWKPTIFFSFPRAGVGNEVTQLRCDHAFSTRQRRGVRRLDAGAS